MLFPPGDLWKRVLRPPSPLPPGTPLAWSPADDTKRIVTPAEALRLGADYLVIGRPITQAEDPPAAARRILDEMAG